VGRVDGYFSVRRKPNSQAIETISALYKVMLDEEKKTGPRDAIAASTKILTDLISQKGTSYEELVIGLQG
jgi:hypothetical protein